ncbi:MAG: hypothetical protein ACE5JN_01225 [Candidatus Methylomirabilia bacterium]
MSSPMMTPTGREVLADERSYYGLARLKAELFHREAMLPATQSSSHGDL